MITKIFALVAVLSLTMAVSILYLVYGFGLEPKSWTAIIGLGLFGQLIAHGLARAVIDGE